MDTQEHEFSLTENNEVISKTVINELKSGTLKITKYDSNNKSLANVKFEITDESGKVVDTITTDANGLASSKKLVVGKYYYQEIEAPENVVMDTNKYEFVLESENQVIEKTVINEIKTGKLKIIKVDENNKPLAGVMFNIYDLNKNLVDTIVTDENGVAESKELEKGKYYYQEIKAPEGIIVDNTMYEFEIVEDGQNVIKNMINYYIKGELKVYKLEENTNKPLANAKFNIYDNNNNLVDTIVTDIDGIAISKKLIYGSYYYKEVEAPEGYILDTTVYEFKIKQQRQESAVVYNKKIEIPVTGGILSMDAQIIILVSTISIFGYLVIILLRRKEQI